MKNAFKVKAMLRITGIVALVAVIGFSMTACGGGGGGGGDDSSATFYIKNSLSYAITSVSFEDNVYDTMELVTFDKTIAAGATSDPYKISWSSAFDIDNFIIRFTAEGNTYKGGNVSAVNGGTYTITISTDGTGYVVEQEPDPNL